MPNKTTQILKEFREKFTIDVARVLFGDPEELKKQGWEVGKSRLIIKQDAEPEEIEQFITEALSKQQQEILDLEIMKDEEETEDNNYGGPDEYLDNPIARLRNEFRKELRQAIAEKRGKG